jgi:heat shock protein HtpX
MWIMALADAVSRIVRVMSFAGQVLILINLPMFLTEYGAMPWLPLLLLAFAPTLSALLQLALSRSREFDADLEAARLTGDPLGLADALEKLERHQEHLWRRVLLPGYRNRQPSLLRTHPNSAERIARLRALAQSAARGPEYGAARAPEHSAVRPPESLSPHPLLATDWLPPRARPRQRWHGLWF